MVDIRSEIKRGFLRQIAQSAIANSLTLGEAILAAQGAVYTPSFQQGRLLVSTSGSGQSASFEIAVNGKDFTQDTIFAMLEEFLDVLTATCTQYGYSDDANPVNTEIIRAAMCQSDSLRGIRSQMLDVSGLNYPATSLT